MNWKTMLLSALIAGISTTLYAEPQPEPILRVEEGPAAKTLYVHLANLQEKDTRVEILDREGRTWYREVLNEDNGFSVLLHLSRVPEATYLLHVWNRKFESTRAFCVRNGSLHLFEQVTPASPAQKLVRETAVRSPKAGHLITYFTPGEGSLLHIQLANLRGEPATIEFGDYRQPAWMTDKVENANGYSREWNLRGIRDGRYYFLVETAGTSLLQELELENGEVKLLRRQMLGPNR